MSKKLLFKGGHATGMARYEIEDFSTLYMRDARVDEKTKAYIDSVIGNSVLNLCPYRNVLVTHKYDTVEGNVVTLDDCQDDEVIQLSEVQGNTMVNYCKDGSKELTLNGDIDTSGYNNVTLTEGVDGGKVDIALEGNTMVNVCDQEEPIAITKNYEVTTGNHIALQGEYDGKCRPNIYGNTLVNLVDTTSFSSGTQWLQLLKLKYSIIGKTITIINKANKQIRFQLSNLAGNYKSQTIISANSKQVVTVDNESQFRMVQGYYTNDGWTTDDLDYFKQSIIILEGDYTNKPIPDYFTGMKSSFEDKLVPENLINYNEVVCNYNEAKNYQSINTKANQIYTVVVNILENTCDKGVWFSAYEFIGQSAVNSYYLGDVNQGNIQLASQGKTGIFKLRIGYTQLGSKGTRFVLFSENSTSGSFKATAYVVEGDYTNYDFTNYDSTKGGKYKVDYKVTGKNLFNFNKLTNTFYNVPNLNAVRDNDNQQYIISGSTERKYVTIGEYFDTDTFKHGKTYTVKNYVSNIDIVIQFVISYKHPITGKDTYIVSRVGATTFTYDKSWGAMHVYCQIDNILDNISPFTIKFQIEEGTTATTYEPYKEFTKTLYLNSPLLEGDTIEQSGNDIVHVHRYASVVLDGSEDEKWYEDNVNLDARDNFSAYYLNTNIGTQTVSGGASYVTLSNSVLCDKFYEVMYDYATGNRGDTSGIATINTRILLSIPKAKLSTQDLAGFKQWLQQNPITVAYKLTTPIQEIISTNDNLILDSYTNGHLDVDTVVPIDKVVFRNMEFPLKYLYPNTEYTIQFESDNVGKLYYIYTNGNTTTQNNSIVKGVNKVTVTTPNEVLYNSMVIDGIGFNASKIVVTPKVDGDFEYFKGMKSVGECEGNKIEILSNNKNLLDNLIPYPFDVIKGNTTTGYDGAFLGVVKVKPNTTYIMSATRDKKAGRVIAKMSNRIILPTELPYEIFSQNYIYNFLKDNYANGRSFEKTLYSQDYITFTTFSDCNYLYVNVDGAYNISNKGDKFTINNVQIEEIKDETTLPTSYTTHKHNKKEILLNEPLRGLPNGVRDKYAMMDGKWYIERNCGKGVVDNSWSIYFNAGQDSENYSCFTLRKNNFKPRDEFNYVVGDIFASNENYWNSMDKEGICIHPNQCIVLRINNLKLQTKDEQGLSQYLQQNPITIIYPLETPTYEPIDYNPFEVYTDITHISNNSIIPCNMQIKNSGYNCILKPSTLYTIALDTNKSGTIGINLGGIKGTTSNNVTTITTPATLTDNTLRLYGKGIKGSKVRLLEGDKTNWIPSHFEGMKSCFEDRLQNDGKYKMEILSRNSDESLSNKIQFLMNEPLRGLPSGVKDKYVIKNGKLYIQRNVGCKDLIVMGGNNWGKQVADGMVGFHGIMDMGANYNAGGSEIAGNIVCDKLPSIARGQLKTTKYDAIIRGDTYVGIVAKADELETQDLDGFKKYINSLNAKFIYNLATPTYEEVECDLSKLALEGYDHGTLFYDTNIPVTTQFYDFNVNIKDMLIPNETYYVTFIADRVKDITINLSGVQVNYKTSMGYNKVPVQLGNVVNTNFSMDSRGVELSDLMISTSTSLIYVKDMNDVCVYDEASNKYSITITSTGGNESDKRVILLDYPLLKLNKDVYDRLYYSNKDSRYRIDKKVFKHKFTNDQEYSKYAVETNDTYYSSFISLNEAIKDYVVITNEKVKTVKVENDKYYFKIKWSDLGVSDKTEANGNQGVKDFFNNNEVYLYYATDGFVEIVDGLTRQTLKVYQPETFMKFLGNTTTTVTILIPMKNV